MALHRPRATNAEERRQSFDMGSVAVEPALGTGRSALDVRTPPLECQRDPGTSARCRVPVPAPVKSVVPPPIRRAMLNRETVSIAPAGELVGVSRRTIYNWI